MYRRLLQGMLDTSTPLQAEHCKLLVGGPAILFSTSRFVARPARSDVKFASYTIYEVTAIN